MFRIALVVLVALSGAISGSGQSTVSPVAAVFPEPGSNNVSRTTRLLVRLNGSYSAPTAALRKSGSTVAIPLTTDITNYSIRDFAWRPTQALDSNSAYEFSVGLGSLTSTFTFTTGSDFDTVPPQLVSVTPAASIDGIDPFVPFRFTFSEPLLNSNLGVSVNTTTSPNAFFASLSLDRRVITVNLLRGPIPPTLEISITPASIIDLSGNPAGPGTISRRWLTAPLQTNADLTVLGQYPPAGAIGVPINAAIELLFNKSINYFIPPTGIIIESDAGVVAVANYQISDKLVVFTPTLLSPNTTYRVRITKAFLALDNSAPASEIVSTFTTGASADAAAQFYPSFSPNSSAASAPTNAKIAFRFYNPLPDFSPLLFDPANTLSAGGSPVPVRISLQDDRQTLVFTTLAPLPPNTSFNLTINRLHDIYGREINAAVGGITGDSRLLEPPAVVSSSPSDGAQDVPLDIPIRILLTSPLGITTPPDAVQLFTAAGQLVDGQTTPLSSNTYQGVAGTSLDFVPKSKLAANTDYEFRLAGVEDWAGNVMPTRSIRFRTGSSFSATLPFPKLISDNFYGRQIDYLQPVELRYDQPLSAAFSQFTVTVTVPRQFDSGLLFNIPLRVDITSGTVRATPLFGWPVGRVLNVSFQGKDLAGHSISYTGVFGAAPPASSDTTRVISVTPPTGTPLSAGDAIRIQFSQPVFEAGVADGGLLYSDSIQTWIPRLVTWSDDRRTVTISDSLSNYQDGKQVAISLAVSSALLDYAGKPVAAATFAWTVGSLTPPPSTSGTPNGTAKWPSYPAVLTGRSPIVILLDRSADAGAFNTNLVVLTSVGRVVGTWRIEGLLASFLPDSDWPATGIAATLLDRGTTLLASDTLSFAIRGVAPVVDGVPAFLDSSITSPGVPSDVVLQVKFDQDPPPNAVAILSGRQYFEGIIPVTERRIRPGVVEYTPKVPLKPGDSLYLRTQAPLTNASSPTAIIGQPTTGPASLLAVTPAEGAQKVARNANISVMFDAGINPLTVPAIISANADNGESTQLLFQSHAFPSNGLEFTPLAPFPANTTLHVQIDQLEDLAGRSLPSVSWSFSTAGIILDNRAPALVSSNISTGNSGPVVQLDPNGPFDVTFDEPLDPVLTNAAMTNNNFIDNLVWTYSSDLRTIHFLAPPSGWARGQTYRFDRYAAIDWSGNRFNFEVQFAVAFDPDSTPSTTLAYSPRDGDTGVPLNTKIGIAFDRQPNADAANEIYLTHGAQRIAVRQTYSALANRLLLMPVVLLEPETQYQLNIGPVSSGIGTPGASLTTSFTTGSAVELNAAKGTVVTSTINDPIRVDFTSVMDITQAPSSPLTLADSRGYYHPVAAQLVWSVDRRSVTIKPKSPLLENQLYQLSFTATTRSGVNSGVSTAFQLTAAPPVPLTTPVLTFVPRDGSTGIPLNSFLQVMVNRNTLIMPTVHLYEDESPVVFQNGYSQFSNVIAISYSLKPGHRYRIETDPFTGTGGTVYPGASATFTTGPSADFSGLQFLSAKPANGDVGISVDTPLELTFNKTLYPLFYPSQLPQSSHNFPYALSFEFDGPVMRARPNPSWPAASSITWFLYPYSSNFSLSDLVGNRFNTNLTLSFRTNAIADPTPPVIESVSPPADTILPGGVPASISIRFSKAIVIPAGALQIFMGSQQPNANQVFSADYRTLTITLTPTANSRLTIIGTDGIRDNADNSLSPFVLEFPTGDSAPVGFPTPTLVDPRPYATGVAPTTGITLRFDRPMDVSSVFSGVRVTENGQNVTGNFDTPDGGITFKFQPDQPLPAGAMVRIFVLASVMSTAGDPVSFSNSDTLGFTVAGTASPSGAVAPQISRRGFDHTAPSGAPLEVEFDQDLDPRSVHDDSVWLRHGNSLVAGVASLRDSRVLHFQPTHPLIPGDQYVLTAGASLQAANGQFFIGRDLRFTAVPSDEAPPPEIELIEQVELQGRPAWRVRMTQPMSPLAGRNIRMTANSMRVPAEVLSSPDPRVWWVVPGIPLRKQKVTIVWSEAPAASGRTVSLEHQVSVQ